MAQRDRAAADVVADLDREVKQADQVGDGRAVLLADAARDLVVGEVEARLQRLVALGLLDGVEVVALEVLGDRHDRGGRVVDLAQHDGDELESGLDGGALAAFADPRTGRTIPGITVRELERRVARLHAPVVERKTGTPDIPESYCRQLTEEIHKQLGCAVRLTSGMTHANGKHVKGVLEIDFIDNDDLDRLLAMMGVKMD